MYYLLILAVVLGILAYLSMLWSTRVNHNVKIYRSSSADHAELKKIATELPGIIQYTKIEQHFSYKREIEGVKRTFKKFYDDFKPDYEDTIIPANTLLNNKYYVKSKLKDLLCIKNNTYHLPGKKGESIPVVRWLAQQMLVFCGCRIDEKKIITLLTYYQKAKPLRYKELYQFMDMLRLELLLGLSEISKYSLNTFEEYERSIEFKDSIFAIPAFSPDREKKTTAKLKSASDAFVARFYIELLDASSEGEDLLQHLFRASRERGIDVQNIAAAQQRTMAAKAVLAESIIESLRNLDKISYDKILKRISPVENLLLRDPAQVYTKMDKPSKEIYRRAIEKISDRLRVSEYDVVDTVYQLSLEDNEHMGHYLLRDRGMEVLAKQYGSRTFSNHTRKAKLYALCISFVTILLAALFAIIGLQWGIGWLILLPALLLVPFFFSTATRWINKIISRFIKSNNVPSIAFKRGVPSDAATLVVVAALVTSDTQLDDILHNLYMNYCSNGEDNIYFSLLMDCKPSVVEQSQQDKYLLDYAKNKIEDLNNRIDKKAFFLFSRKKRYYEAKDHFAPWERKRGAVLELNDLLIQKKSEHFNESNLPNELASIKYVITLDEDTTIPTGEAKKMIGAMAHPLNCPIVNDGILESGYAILQPDVRIRLEDAYHNTFSKIYCGMKGYDRYNSRTAGLIMGLFGHSIFFGKGIYDPRAFNAVLKKKFPDGQILSHDLIEGGFVGVGSVAASLIEGFPSNVFSYYKRVDRWLRGDWQILPWLGRIVRNRSNQRVVNTLGFSVRFIMFSNIFVSLAPILTVLAILSSALLGSFSMLLIYIGGAMFLRLLIITSADLILRGQIGEQTAFSLRESMLSLSLLPYSAYINGRAIFTALYRMLFDREKLMKWSTAASSRSQIDDRPVQFFLSMWPSLVLALLLVLMAIISQTSTVIVLLAALGFVLGIFFVYGANRDKKREAFEPTEEQRAFLHHMLDKTYQYFVEFTDQRTGLTCDNYQEYNDVGCATRTSPTNIGFTMLSHLIAMETGMVEPEVCFSRILRTLDTVKSMEKWRGHLYNWYDTESAEPLHPMYVSSVDCGNFKLLLMLVGNYIEHHVERESALQSQYQAIMERIHGLLDAMDFRDLYDDDKEMFYIGYDATNHRYSDSHYDLLMSESRQISYIEVAQRHINESHWNRLDRPLSCENHKNVMMSWGGSTFEYFMPTLFFETREHSLLDTTLHNYIKVQREYCIKHNMPFGVSESGYNDFDLMLNYQYKSFGVPGTGYKRGLKDELVSSPYGAALILPFDPALAIASLERYAALRAVGDCGFYEAMDFTKERIPKDTDYAIIKSYMAHHQGMIMAALFNYLYDNKIKKAFMSIPLIEASASLLEEPEATECVKKAAIFEFNEDTMPSKPLLDHVATYKNYNLDSKYLPISWLSNGAYALHINAAGAGQSLYNGFAINRWDDANRQRNGIFAFIKEEGRIFGFSGNYGNQEADTQEFTIDINRALFRRWFDDLSVAQEITISHEMNVELRKYTIFNNGKRPRKFKMYIYGEPALCPQESYVSHRTYQNLFLESKLIDERTLLYNRRKKFDGQRSLSVAWRIYTGAPKESIAFGNDRERCLGRYRQLNNARMFDETLLMRPHVVEPAMAVSLEIDLGPGADQAVYLVQAAAQDEESCILMLSKLTGIERIRNSMDIGRARQRARLRFAGLDNKHMRLLNKMLPLLLNNELLQSSARQAILSNKLPKTSLWRMGVSGDLPVILVSIEDDENIFRVEHLLKVYMWLVNNGLKAEMVIINLQDDSYKDDMTERLFALRTKYTINCERIRERIKILAKDRITPEELNLLHAIANCYFDTHLPLIAQTTLTLRESFKEDIDYPVAQGYAESLQKLAFYNTFGGFDPASGEYIIRVDDKKHPPMPWCNVITNGLMGAVVSEKGLSYSWYLNARENKITHFDNDPILNTCPLKLRFDNETKGVNLWTLGGDNIGPWTVHHGFGYSIYRRVCESVEMKVTIFAPRGDKAMVFRIDLCNTGSEKVQLKVILEADLVIGGGDSRYIVDCPSLTSNIRFAKNNYHTNLFGKIVYLALPKTFNHVPGERHKYGKNDDFKITQRYEILPGKPLSVTALLGVCDVEGEGLQLSRKYASVENVAKEFKLMKDSWCQNLSKIKVSTPDQSIDLLMNGRLMYQTLASRLIGRTGFYQCGGALGFRDQLQDVLSLLWFQSDYTKSTILDFAAHQFESGDVQHWWHAPYNGVRTRIKDDMLFLPYVCSAYIEHTGDDEILDEQIPYLVDVEIPSGEDDWYGTPEVSKSSGTLLEHCLRAIDCCSQFGQHGLPLMGGGDWNDGMNRVGHKGVGESIWLGFFLLDVMQRMYPLLMKKGLFEEAEIMINRITVLKGKLNDTGWDGKWYKRAYYDNGAPMGSASCAECKIDCISQAWAVLSRTADKQRADKSLSSTLELLYDEEHQILKLLWPPFNTCEHDPGYIKGYIPGIRENGGQYTHGALWVVWALCQSGRGSDAFRVMKALNPINHALCEECVQTYKVEPYVTAADVYSAEGLEGRGGWTWYTGSAGWMYKIILESILGLRKQGDKLYIDPCIDSNWPGFSIAYRHGSTYYHIEVRNPEHETKGIRSLRLDGKELSEGYLPLVDDKREHKVFAVM